VKKPRKTACPPQKIDLPPLAIPEEISDAVSDLFQSAFLLDNATWNIQLAPPGHRFYREEFLSEIEGHAASVRCALRKLRRAVRAVAPNPFADELEDVPATDAEGMAR
jgi:hypothetical protein